MTLLPHPFGCLAVQDRAADVPVQQEQLGVDHACGPDPGLSDLGFEVLEEVAVVVGEQSGVTHRPILPY